MNRVLIIIALIVSALQFGLAQTDDNLHQQMEEFKQQMREMTEQLSKQFGGNSFYFDTSFVMPFDSRSFDGMNFPFDSSMIKNFGFFKFDGEDFETFPFDTSMLKGFRWYGSGEMPMQMDTLIFKEFKNFNGEDFPGLQFDEEWSKNLSEMMERMMKQLEGFGQEFDENGQHYYFREWKSTPEEQDKDQPKAAPKPAPQKKRKTTSI
ncbi:MAG: hypothetical protein ACK4TA_10830 [Saprospiraceae bacterium]